MYIDGAAVFAILMVVWIAAGCPPVWLWGKPGSNGSSGAKLLPPGLPQGQVLEGRRSANGTYDATPRKSPKLSTILIWVLVIVIVVGVVLSIMK